MANNTTGSPIYIDTLGAGVALTNVHMVYGFAWVSNEGVGLDIAVDDDLIITDGNNRKFIGKRAKAAGQGLEITFKHPVKPSKGKLNITAMDGGILYIFN